MKTNRLVIYTSNKEKPVPKVFGCIESVEEAVFFNRVIKLENAVNEFLLKVNPASNSPLNHGALLLKIGRTKIKASWNYSSVIKHSIKVDRMKINFDHTEINECDIVELVSLILSLCNISYQKMIGKVGDFLNSALIEKSEDELRLYLEVK